VTTCAQPGCGGTIQDGYCDTCGLAAILGCEPNARALRFGLERSYRALARLTPDEDRRIELVDLAYAIRPRTLT
jgi:serine/threonine-protein kinase PknG